jgi:hypothetical protein
VLTEKIVAASEIENPLPCIRLQQVEHWLPQRGNKMRVLGVAISFPLLA